MVAGKAWTHSLPLRPRSFWSAARTNTRGGSHFVFTSCSSPVSISKVFCSSCGENCPLEAKYCHKCGDRLQHNATEGAAIVDELIKGYFHRGYPYQAIVGLLDKQDGVQMHVRTLKRKLRDLGLKRKEANHDENIVRDLVKQEMQGAGSLAGYRYIWHALRLRHHVNVPRSQVASIMKDIDPEGVQKRKSRRLRRRAYVSYGPNFCWHIDGRLFGYISNKVWLGMRLYYQHLSFVIPTHGTCIQFSVH